MDLILLEKNKTGYSTDLVCISEENQIYIPKVFENSPFYLKQGGTVWVKRGDVYDVFELTEDITYENQSELITSLQRTMGFITKNL